MELTKEDAKNLLVLLNRALAGESLTRSVGELVTAGAIVQRIDQFLAAQPAVVPPAPLPLTTE